MRGEEKGRRTDVENWQTHTIANLKSVLAIIVEEGRHEEKRQVIEVVGDMIGGAGI